MLPAQARHARALVEEAREAGLDVARFRVALESNAIVEAFGADLEEARTIPDAARVAGLATAGSHGSAVERLRFPALRLIGEDGDERWVGGEHPYEDLASAATALGAAPTGEPRLDVAGALRRFGRMATAELEAVCDQTGPRAGAEVWRLASEWRVRRIPVLAALGAGLARPDRRRAEAGGPTRCTHGQGHPGAAAPSAVAAEGAQRRASGRGTGSPSSPCRPLATRSRIRPASGNGVSRAGAAAGR